MIAAFAMLILVMTILPMSGTVRGRADLPAGQAGASYKDMTPIDKVVLVNHDRDGYFDDYAFIAEVPASIFHYKPEDRLIMNPVLFYEPEMQVGDTDRIDNTYPAVNYFMEDMVTIADDELDLIEMVGFDGKNPGDIGNTWVASEVRHIDADDPYGYADKIALSNWEYADTAVLAVIKTDDATHEETFEDMLTGVTPDGRPQSGSLSGSKEPSPVDPEMHPFTIPPDYKYITSQLTWGQSWNPLSDITERGKDPDLQLYSSELGQVGASEKWNVLEGASEEIDSYIYNAGEWQFAVTYMPTENSVEMMSDPEGWGGVPQPSETTPAEREEWVEKRIRSVMEDRELRGLNPDTPFDSTVEYTIDYTIYPGIDVMEKIPTPFYCRDAVFTLEWGDASQSLGLILKGPSGAEIAMATAQAQGSRQILEIPELGQGDYSISVINLGDNAQPTEFEVSYEFKQMKCGKEAISWAGATNAAVIASELNAPLLYTSKDGLTDGTGDAINTLGVKDMVVVDVGSLASDEVYDDIDSLRGFLRRDIDVERITSYDQLYDRVKEGANREQTDLNDIVFTTMNPWTTWDVVPERDTSTNPGEETTGALFTGPAALAGAIHGAPVFVNEAHPELSCAQAWHNKFWVYAYHHNRAPPSVACMAMTGKAIYRVLQQYGFDKTDLPNEDGKCKESIITVADQFDIGSSWDRTLVGAADPGRIMGTPVDAAMWVSRSGMYPKVIYANPGVDPELDEHDGYRIQGSSSTRVAGALVIEEEMRETRERFPVAQSWVSYQYKFNEVASEYWGCEYTTRTGITPYFDSSTDTDPDGIDINGCYPDLDTSEVVPHYLEAAGYGQAFTTTFENTMENLNRGVIMWYEVMHGGHTHSGALGWWDERGAEEPEPWRGYEEAGIPIGTNTMRLRGATDDPDVITMSKSVGLDITQGYSPQTPLEIIPEHHDGIIIAIAQQGQTEYSEDGLVMDDAMENLHSMGFSAGSCLIANTYLHLSMVRHGGIFQVIDPWLTSWYSAFAMAMFARDMYYGHTVGDAYERGISHVGIEYLIDGWWWDIFENLVYYGDPDLMMFTPNNAWSEPASLEKGTVLGGHSPFGADGHPNALTSGVWLDILFFGALLGLIGAGAYLYYRWKKGMTVPFIKPDAPSS